MRREWFLAAAVLALAACSGDDDASPATTSSDVPRSTTTAPLQTTEPTADPTTTAATTTTTVPPTTTTPPPTTPPSTDPPASTTLPEGVPPRVTFPDDPEKQAVVDAAYAFFDAARAAQASPGDESLRVALAQTMSDPIASRMTVFLDQLVLDGERIVGSSVQPSYLDVFTETVSAVEGSGILDACAVDGDVRVSGPEGSEMVVDEDVVSGVQTYSLQWDGESWLVRDFETVEQYPGQAGCG